MKGLKGLASAIVLFGLTVCIPHTNAQIQLQQNQPLVESQISPNQANDNNQATRAKLKKAYDLFFTKKDYRASLQLFTEIIQVEPNNQYAYLGRGASYYELRNYQAAKVDLEKSIQIDSSIHFAYFFRGLSNHGLGNKTEAIADLQIAANLFEKDGTKDMVQMTINLINKIRNA